MSTDSGKQTRREFIYGIGTGVGSLALSSLMGCRPNEQGAKIIEKITNVNANPLAAKPAMMIPKAKACIFLMMEGGP